jgi:hypothetical protein
MEMQVTNYG